MNSSKDHILSKIKSIQREVKPLPEIPGFDIDADLKSLFIQSIKLNKGEVISREEFKGLLAAQTFLKVYSRVEGFLTYSNMDLPEDPHHLSELNLAIVKGRFGVAENGAIWFEDEDLGHRALPFITEHLVVVLDSKDLVANMHLVYNRIGQDRSGFGLFIAGPSKTADIEQSLVIGAHGAKSLRVVLE